MNRIIFMFMIILTLFAEKGVCGMKSGKPKDAFSIKIDQDTMRRRQLLYNGIVWRNIYHSIEGDQFFMMDYFLPGKISMNGQTFDNLKIKYDIYSDELLVPINLDEIVQLNKEMIDSFTIVFENRSFNFINLRNDSPSGFTGYLNILYQGKSSLYVKFKKEISHYVTENKLGSFYDNNRIYILKDNNVHLITTTKKLYNILGADDSQFRNFVRHNKLKLSRKRPESYVPLIRYYDSLGH